MKKTKFSGADMLKLMVIDNDLKSFLIARGLKKLPSEADKIFAKLSSAFGGVSEEAMLLYLSAYLGPCISAYINKKLKETKK